MKKIAAVCLLGIAMAFGLTACGNNSGTTAATAQNSQVPPPAVNKGKALVVYFSVPEKAEAKNMNREEENSTVVKDGKVLGNTQYIAQLIQKNTNADLFRIEPVTPYPMNHAELEAAATKEVREKVLPEIAGTVANIAQYDTVFIGYPNWYGDMPRIMYTFFNTYNLSGKTVIPFVTSGASGFSNTIATIQELQPEAKVITNGLSVLRNNAENAEAKVVSWLEGFGYKK